MAKVGARETLEQRFWRRVIQSDDCWEWQGAHTPYGHGQIWDTRRSQIILTHRLAWELAYGPIPDGLYVLHHCDNAPCVRIEHLFLGTKADNSRDMREKGRSRGGGLVGEKNPAAKLTVDQVKAIRHALKGGDAIRATARRYGMSQRTIQRIANGTHWREVVA